MFSHDTWNYIQKNKPLPTNHISIEIELTLMYLLNAESLLSVQQYQDLSDVVNIPWQGVQVAVDLDNEPLYHGSPITCAKIVCNVPDHAIQTKTLSISVQGFDSAHVTKWPYNDYHGSAVLQIGGSIDQIPITVLMLQHGQYRLHTGEIKQADDIMGENGCATLRFETPFYSWLHQHRDQLVWQVASSFEKSVSYLQRT